MIYLTVAGFALVCTLQVYTFVRLLGARPIADAPIKTPDVPVEVADEPVESIDTSELTETELLIIEREAEFDLRIAKMKEELAFSQAPKRENPTEADVLHPLVQNLPHHIIRDAYDSLPDVEYHV